MRSSVVIAAILFAACSRNVQDSAQVPPRSGTVATAGAAKVVFPDGYAVNVEIAADDATREQGLMYRDRLPDDGGMIFLFAQSGDYPFWMKNTLIPLDIVWIDEEKRIVHVGANIPPCRADPCPSYPPNARAKYVLEVAAGVAAKHHLQNGDTLRFEGLDTVPVR